MGWADGGGPNVEAHPSQPPARCYKATLQGQLRVPFDSAQGTVLYRKAHEQATPAQKNLVSERSLGYTVAPQLHKRSQYSENALPQTPQNLKDPEAPRETREQSYQLKNQRIITDPKELPWPLLPQEAAYFAKIELGRLPFAVSSHYLSLAGPEPNDPIRQQIVPRLAELHSKNYELPDPLGEDHYSHNQWHSTPKAQKNKNPKGPKALMPSPESRMVHRYASRLLILLSDHCATYCRHCFRRRFSGQRAGALQYGHLRSIRSYIEQHPEIREILFSGGDPLMMSSTHLKGILEELRQVRSDLVFRIASRTPVVLPQRFDDKLLEVLSNKQPLWLITHFNHSQEINDITRHFIGRIVDAGIPILNQSVLLKGINDQVETLATLFEELVRLRIKPYYLFQGDLAEGTAHLRVPLECAWPIVKKLRSTISGIAMPQFTVDLPGGGGKVPLTENYLLGEEAEFWLFQSQEGQLYRYPKEKQREP